MIPDVPSGEARQGGREEGANAIDMGRAPTKRPRDAMRLGQPRSRLEGSPGHPSSGPRPAISLQRVGKDFRLDRGTTARALALAPDILLLDEPFGSLDAVTRRRLNLELQAIWVEQSVTTVLITHAVDEAVFMADRVYVLSPRPGRGSLVREIPFPRPRDRKLTLIPEFHALTDDLHVALDTQATPPDVLGELE